MTVAEHHNPRGNDADIDSVFDVIRTRNSTTTIYNHEVAITNLIREAHPDHRLTMSLAHAIDLNGYAKAGLARMRVDKSSPAYIADHSYDVPANRLEQAEGTFRDDPAYARLAYSFNGVEYIIYHVTWLQFNRPCSKFFVLSPKDAQTLDASGTSPLNNHLIKEVTLWSRDLHEEIYVFDRGHWSKNKLLYQSVKKASWDDVILHPTTKASIIADIASFFKNRSLYVEFNVPWKRGVILHGPPGNGKTITIKALIHELSQREEEPIPSLYVKTLQNDRGGEYAIRAIFDLARKTAPCILVFEDLDSLVTDELRSYFLNEVDGLESNDGILMLGSTNHLGKLDPAIAKRPSRFDRKYGFELPGHQQRLAYAKYWQAKLAHTSRVSFDLEAIEFFARMTQDFSFAYLKELIVNSLMITIGDSSDQIETELDATLDTVDKQAGEDRAAKIAQMVANHQVPEALKGNKFVQILHKQAAVLRYEMDSITDAEKDFKKSAVPSDPPPGVHYTSSGGLVLGTLRSG